LFGNYILTPLLHLTYNISSNSGGGINLEERKRIRDERMKEKKAKKEKKEEIIPTRLDNLRFNHVLKRNNKHLERKFRTLYFFCLESMNSLH
jgi:hypothetical protein